MLNFIFSKLKGRKRMTILNDTKEYDDVWNKVYSDLIPEIKKK